MILVLLHHALLAAVANLVAFMLLRGAQAHLAHKLDLQLEGEIQGAALVAISAGISAIVACAFYIALSLRPGWFVNLLVLGAVLPPVMSAARTMDRRFTSLSSALLALAIATFLALWMGSPSTLATYLGLLGVGFASLLACPLVPSMPAVIREYFGKIRRDLIAALIAYRRRRIAARAARAKAATQTRREAKGRVEHQLRRLYEAPAVEDVRESREGDDPVR